MYQLFKSRIFYRQFFAFFAIGIIIFTGFGLSVFWSAKNNLEQQSMLTVAHYQDQIFQAIRGKTEDVDSRIAMEANNLRYLGEETFKTDIVTHLIQDMIKIDPTLVDILLIDQYGNIVNSRAGSSSNNLLEREYVKKGLLGYSTVTSFYKSKNNDVIIMTISHPVYVEDKPLYVLAGVVKLDKIKGIFEHINFSSNARAFLVDENGALLVANDDNVMGAELSNTYGVKEAIAGKSGVSKYIDGQGQRVIGAYRWIPMLKLGLIVEFNEEYIFQPIYHIDRTFKHLLIFSGILTIIMAYLISLKTYKPIQGLIDAAQRLKKSSDVHFIELKTNDEIDILINSFNEMQSAIKAREEEIHKYATIDTLTGTFNRRAGMELLNNLLEKSKTEDLDISIMFVDINDLKHVNDKMGHKEGDRLIKLVTAFMRKNLSEQHSIARLGGDEFLVVLPKCTLQQAEEIKRRIEADIDSYNDRGIQKYKVSASFGVAQYDKMAAISTDAFIEIADNGMYKNKELYRQCRVRSSERTS